MNPYVETAQTWLKNAFDHIAQKTTGLNNKVAFTTTTATTSISVLVAYLCAVRYYRYKNLRMIRAKYPDPKEILRDPKAAEYVYSITFAKEFPYLFRLSLELALFKTFTVPSISKILAGTNEFSGGMERSIRRTEDTALLISELNETYGRVQNQLKKDPTTSKENIEKQQHRHSEAIQRMNELHGKYPILNGDYLYTLALFVFEPISWINRYEWRQLDEREINAIFKVWYDIGKEMNIEGIPDTVEEFYNFKEKYAANNIKHHPANWKVAEPTVRVLLTMLPSFLRELLYPSAIRVLPSILDARDAEAFHLPYKENRLITALVRATLRTSALFTKYFMFPRGSFLVRTPFYTNQEGKYVPNHFNYHPSPYVNGYKIEEFGPVKFLKNKTNGAVPAEHPPVAGDMLSSKCPMMH